MIHGCVEDAAGGRIAGLDVHTDDILDADVMWTRYSEDT